MSESLQIATTFCERCSIRNTNLFGFPQFNPSLIFQRILNDILKSNEGVAYSSIIADSLHQDHNDIANAMKELHCAYPDVFVLEESRGNAPVQITELGKLILNKPLLQTVKNEMYYESFVTTYQRTLSNLAIDEGWMVTTASHENGKGFKVIPGPNTSGYEFIQNALMSYFTFNRSISSLSMHKLFDFDLVGPGPNIITFHLKKGKRFPHDQNELFEIWLSMIRRSSVKRKFK